VQQSPESDRSMAPPIQSGCSGGAASRYKVYQVFRVRREISRNSAITLAP
jgi:hypothetical protein